MKKVWLAGLLAVAAFSGAYASEIATEVAVPQIAGAVNEASTGSAQADAQIDAELEALLNETAVSSVSKAAPLQDYFTIETSALQEAGQAKLAQWQDELYDRVQELGSMVRKMADDGVVASDEFFDLEKPLKSYGNLLSYANKELAFYRLSIPEDGQVNAYWRLHNIHARHILGDDRRESVRRFFFNLTGKDVRVKVNWEDIVGKTLLAPIATPFIVILEATGN